MTARGTTTTMTNRWYGVTDRGTVRELNQDAFCAPGILVGRQASARRDGVFSFASSAPALWAVSDGMGGHEAGEEASTLTVQLLTWDVQNRWPALYSEGQDPKIFISEALRVFSTKLNELAQGQIRPMGCTLTGVWVPAENQSAWVFHVGDSRLWRAKPTQNSLQLLTQDHNFAFGRSDGQGKNLLESCLGGGMDDQRFDVFPLEVAQGDVWLLVTDGLEDGLDPATFETLLWQNVRSPSRLAEGLLNQALPKSTDNITLLAVAWD